MIFLLFYLQIRTQTQVLSYFFKLIKGHSQDSHKNSLPPVATLFKAITYTIHWNFKYRLDNYTATKLINYFISKAYSLIFLRHGVRKISFERRFCSRIVQRSISKVSRNGMSYSVWGCCSSCRQKKPVWLEWAILNTRRLDSVNWMKINVYLNKLVIIKTQRKRL